MKRITWNSLAESDRQAALARPERRVGDEVLSRVAGIFDELRASHGEALDAIAERIDGAPPRTIAVTPDVVREARAKLTPEDISAMTLARGHILAFHERTRPTSVKIEIAPGVLCKREWRPIQRVGLYVPGGSAPLFSSLLMQALPAKAAGVPEIYVATPPGSSEIAETLMIVAADLCGLQAITVLGGAQAIAAMALGYGPFPKIDKIFGPGGAYVAAAKTYATGLPGGPAIDLPAGPSELLVIADDTADPGVVAADLLSQAEHDADAQVILVTLSDAIADAVDAALEQQLATLPRADIARASLAEGRAIIVEDMDAAVTAANAYAPEHLSLNVAEAEKLAGRIFNAGAVFVGAWSAETFGDYVCGPSHVLPTDGAARAWGGVTTESFMRPISIQELNETGASKLSDAAARLARLEGLEAHARAADMRRAGGG
jgi:histidinol dehydrogenase